MFPPTRVWSKSTWGADMTAMLEAHNVDLYYGAAQALRQVSLTAEVGKVTAIMGRNGVGKSSFLRAIVGEHAIASGTISLNGAPLGRMATHDRARLGIGYVPQGRDIFPLLSVRENLETGYAPLKRDDRTIPPDVFDLFPVLRDMLRRRGGDLSGGQQQQLAIGRAISWLRTKGDMAILLVEQYFDFVRELADTFAIMDRGEIVLSGVQADMDSPEVRRHLTV